MTQYGFSQPWLSMQDDPKTAPTALEFAHLRSYLNGIDNGTIPLYSPSFQYFTPGTVLGNIAMNGFKLTGLGAGTGNGDSLRYEQLIGLYLLLTGGTMSGDIAMGTHNISNGGIITSAQFDATTQYNLNGNHAVPLLQAFYVSTTTGTSTTGNTFITTNLAQAITPKSTTSQIMISAAIQSRISGSPNGSAGIELALDRSGTNLLSDARSFGVNANTGVTVDQWSRIPFFYLDSPNTTSSRTYTIQFRVPSGFGGTAAVQDGGGTSHMLVFELGS